MRMQYGIAADDHVLTHSHKSPIEAPSPICAVTAIAAEDERPASDAAADKTVQRARES